MMKKIAALAFSGGLDTSFCVPHLIDEGWDVVTLFVDTGGVDDAAKERIAARSRELGAVDHVAEDASDELWSDFVVPFVMGGALYQGRYPLLCSDRYVIASRLARLAERTGAAAVAHGCTAMGNDQVRFDQSLRCLTDLPILAPIRAIQSITDQPRAHEMTYLGERGVDVPEDVKRYSINENLLGATLSGSEIDRHEPPGPDTRRLTAPPEQWPREPVSVRIGFERGEAVSLDGRPMSGPAILKALNQRLGGCGVGRGVYTGDTVIGLKGRIVFEAPGLIGLLTAHKGLEERNLTQAQGAFKPVVAQRWTELVYSGFFFEPLRRDLEGLIRSTQERVTGEVTLEAAGAACEAVQTVTEHALERPGAVYAQRSDWSATEAEGFIKLNGMSSALAGRTSGATAAAAAGKEASAACASGS